MPIWMYPPVEERPDAQAGPEAGSAKEHAFKAFRAEMLIFLEGQNQKLAPSFISKDAIKVPPLIDDLLSGRDISARLVASSSRTLTYHREFFDALKTHLHDVWGIDAEIGDKPGTEAIKDDQGRANDVAIRILSVRLTNSPEDIENRIIQTARANGLIPAAPAETDRATPAETGSATSPDLTTPLQRANQMSAPPATATPANAAVLMSQFAEDADKMRSLIQQLENNNPDNFTNADALLQSISSLVNAPGSGLLSRMVGAGLTQSEQNGQIQAFWNYVLSGMPADFTYRSAFGNGTGYVSGTTDTAVYRQMAVIVLIHEVDATLKEALSGQMSAAAARTQYDALISQMRNKGAMEQAARTLYGRNGEALDELMSRLQLPSAGLPAGDKFLTLSAYVITNATSLNSQWTGFMAAYDGGQVDSKTGQPQGAAGLIMYRLYDMDLSDSTWAKLGILDNAGQPQSKISSRSAIDAFTTLALVHDALNGEFGNYVSDHFLYSVADRLSYMPPRTAVLVASHPEILINLGKQINNEGTALGLFDIGIRDMGGIYSSVPYADRFAALQYYAEGWAKLTANASLLSHVLSQTVHGREYNQIEINDPRLELFQTFGRTDFTFNLDIYARLRLGSLLFNDRPVFQHFGSGYTDDNRIVADQNAFEAERVFSSRPFTYMQNAAWYPPALQLRLDYGAYNDALFQLQRRTFNNYNQENISVRGYGLAAQRSTVPDMSQTDIGASMSGRKWGQSAFAGLSTSSQSNKNAAGAEVSAEDAQAARIDGQNLQSSTARVYKVFADWLAHQSTSTSSQASNIKLEQVDERLVDGVDAYLYGADIIISGTHAFNKTQKDASASLISKDDVQTALNQLVSDGTITLNQSNAITNALPRLSKFSSNDIQTAVDSIPSASPDALTDNQSAAVISGLSGKFTTYSGIRTQTGKADDFNVFIRTGAGWYRAAFTARQRASLLDDLNGANISVDSDGLLEHQYHELATRATAPVQADVGYETYFSRDQLAGEDTGPRNGYFAAFRFPTGAKSQMAAVKAQSIAGENAIAAAELFGSVKDGSVLYASVFNIRETAIGRTAQGTPYSGDRGLGPRAYMPGEQDARDRRAGTDMRIANLAWTAIEQHKFQLFAGGPAGAYKTGVAGGSFSNRHFGLGSFFTFDNGRPIERFTGFGAQSEFITLSAFYYQNQQPGQAGQPAQPTEQYGWTTRVRLGEKTTLFTNALVDPNLLSTAFTPRRMNSVLTSVQALEAAIVAGQASADADYNARKALYRQWVQNLLAIHSDLLNYLPTYEYWAQQAQFSLGLTSGEGLYKLTYSKTNDGNFAAGLLCPTKNTSFFFVSPLQNSRRAALGPLGGAKFVSGDFEIAGTYNQLDGRDVAGLQLFVRNTLGISAFAGGQKTDNVWRANYARASLLFGGRPANILIDYSQAGDLTAYGITGSARVALDLDATVAWAREQLHVGFSSNTYTASAYWQTDPNTQLQLGVSGTWFADQRWEWLRVGFQKRF